MLGLNLKTATCASLFTSLSVISSGAFCQNKIIEINDFPKMKEQEPNTVKGLITNGHKGDYALLRGRFVKKVGDDIYEFTDGNDALFVSFEGVNIPSDLEMDYPYLLWSKIIRNDKLTILGALFISPKV